MSKLNSSADRFIGARIRERRLTLGFTMHQFSELIGVTYQQIFKYEHGINTISAGQLFAIARGSGTPIEYFFEGLERNEGQLPRGLDILSDLMSSLHEMQNEKQLEAISQLIRSLVGG